MNKITAEHLARQAVVYVRQSTQGQLQHNHESRRQGQLQHNHESRRSVRSGGPRA